VYSLDEATGTDVMMPTIP